MWNSYLGPKKEHLPKIRRQKHVGFFFFPENVNCVARWLLSSQEGMNRQTQMTKSLQVKLKEKGKEKEQSCTAFFG